MLIDRIFSKTKTQKSKIYKIFNLEIVVPKKKKNLDYRTLSLFGLVFRLPRRKMFETICERAEIQPNKIVFCNFLGKSYGCNPKYITEQIIKENLPYDLVWLVKDSLKERINFPQRVRLVNIDSKQAYKELGSAKIWIDNCRKNKQISRGLVKKEGQYYIQTWHGSMGIKKLDADVPQFLENPDWVELSKRDASLMDYFLTNSDFEREVVTRAMWFRNDIKEFGHPRNDIFFNDLNKTKEKILNYYGLNNDKKLLLYVPSFRDNQDLSWFTIDYEKVLSALAQRFGGDWIFMVRFHPRVKLLLSGNDGRIVNVSAYPDIQELLAGCDVAISDYSSCMYDFLLTRRPGFLFAPDRKQYDNIRGLYFPLEATPFPVAENNSQLFEQITSFDSELYAKKCETFLEEKGCYEDGHASERVVDLIKQIMNDDRRIGDKSELQ